MIYNANREPVYTAYDIDKKDRESVFDIFGNQVAIDSKPTDPYLKDRLLVFEDDFSEGLSDENWSVEVGYMRGLKNQFSSGKNVKVENGVLHLILKKENYLGYTYTIPGINSRGKKAWVYGRFEAKIKIPPEYNGAFWSMSNNALEKFSVNENGTMPYLMQDGVEGQLKWPVCGEIDTMESDVSNTRMEPWCNLWAYDGESLGGSKIPFSITDNEWHVYALEKTDSYIAMLIDNVEYKRYTYSDYLNGEVDAYNSDLAYMMMFGLGVTNQSDTSVENATMYVDWVRVYAPTGIEAPVRPTSIYIQPNFKLKLGYCTCLIPVITPINATERDITWISAEPSICRCEAGGKIYGEHVGETDIYALTQNNKISRCHITVTAELADINDIIIGTAWNLTTNSARAVLFVAVQPSTEYTLSFDSISNFEGVYWFEKESRGATTLLVDEKLTEISKTQVTTANTGYMCIQFNKPNISMADFEGINMSLVRSN